MNSAISNPAAVHALDSPERLIRDGGAVEEQVLELFDLFRMRLLRYALSFGISIPDAEDIVQETFLALFNHLRRGRPQNNLPAWLFRVTHNLSLKMNMRTVHELADSALEEFDRFDPSPGPEEYLLIGERRMRLQSVLRALPLEDRLCLQLRAEGLRYREIARVVGVSLGSVSISLRRSFGRLEAADRREAYVR